MKAIAEPFYPQHQRPLYKRVRKRVRRFLRLDPPYQAKRVAGTDRRWDLISERLGPDDRSLLDIGCNLGVLTRRAAEANLFAVGIEPDKRFLRRAQRRNQDVPNLAFALGYLTPEVVKNLPTFDVILCLSVHHSLARAYGLDAAWEIVGQLMARSRRHFFFEPASIRHKYRLAAPDIVDNDRESISNYNIERLRALASPEQVVEYVGESACLGNEPFRHLFHVGRL